MFEDIRNAKLIEERMAYEENLFNSSSRDIEKSMELDYQINEYQSSLLFNDCADELMYLEVFDEEMMMEQEIYEIQMQYDCNVEELEYNLFVNDLIEERLAYEENFLNNAWKDIKKSYELDYQIKSYEHEMDNLEVFEEYEIYNDEFIEDYGPIELDCYFEEIDMVATYDGFGMHGYIREDDPFDSLDGWGFPEY